VIVRALLALSSCIAIAACSMPRAPFGPPPEPMRCAAVYSEPRCVAIAERVAAESPVDGQAVVDFHIAPEPTPQVAEDGTMVIVSHSGNPVVVRVTLEDGSTRDVYVGCAGIGDPADPICTDVPRLHTFAIGGEGYRDLPCGADGDTCATPVPPPDPNLVLASSPIIVDHVDVPIDHVGPYAIRIGAGSLPNGVLSDASFRLVDEWPDGVTLEGGSVLLDVRSLEPDGRPFDNYYNHGWREDLERIEAVLVFEVKGFEPGATLSVADVVVR
jgi:hypothetical protein